MTVYAIRHGQSEANARMAYSGWAQVPLTERGRQDAERARELVKDIHFDRVITSDLLRAIQTADIAVPGYERETDPRLREISVGNLAGRLIADCQQLGEVYLQNRRIHNYVPYGGENQAQLLARVADFMEELRRTTVEGNVALVCHEGAIIAMLCHVLGHRIDHMRVRAANGSVSVFTYEDDLWRLRQWSETGRPFELKP